MRQAQQGTSPRPLAESCAQTIEREILAGALLPGQRLDETALGARLSVSRNTLREAFRLLARERIVEHEPNRGVFVRSIDAAQAREIYEVRRQLEVGALETLRTKVSVDGLQLTPELLAQVERAVTEGERARGRDDWLAVGTANAEFHLALVELSGNQVAQGFMRVLSSLTRLRFLTLGDPRGVHEKYLDENRRIYELLRIGEVGRAGAALESYLLRAAAELA